MDRGYTGLVGLYDYFFNRKMKLHKQELETTIILLPTLLPNLFVVDYKWLQNFTEYPKRLLLGFTIIRKKMKER